MLEDRNPLTQKLTQLHKIENLVINSLNKAHTLVGYKGKCFLSHRVNSVNTHNITKVPLLLGGLVYLKHNLS